MNRTTRQHTYTIFITLFIALNIFNTYFLTTSALNKYIAPFSHTFIGELTAILGNMGILLLLVFMVSIVVKSVRLRMIILTILTFGLNFFIFALGAFNLYYGTAFAFNMLTIFNNPAQGFANQTVIEVFKELIVYYRIVVFIPFFTLLTWTVVYAKKVKGLKATFNYKRLLTQLIAIIAIVLVTSVTFTRQLITNMPIQSEVSSYAVQNYGVYPYYLKEYLGIKTIINPEDTLDISSNEDALTVLSAYNKNVSSYTNAINGQTYSNQLLTGQANVDYIDPSFQNTGMINGIFEGKNIVLIQVESLNQFLLQNEYTRANMSFLVNLLSESYVFNNFYTNVGMGVSSDAESIVLTGLNPQGDRTMYWDYNDIPYELPSIIKYLGNEGYHTAAIHGDHEAFYNRNVVYSGLYQFDESYSLENFIADGYDVDNGFVYNHEQQLSHKSPWVSDYYLGDFVSTYGHNQTEPFMLFPITMMGHTPFDFGPLGATPDIYPNYAPFIHEMTLKYLNYANYYSETIKRFFIADGGDDQTLDDTIYVFYGDHGSGLKNGDLEILFDNELTELEERRMLQQTVAFIYAPSNNQYVDFGNYQLRKGMLTGEQDLVRSEVDLYRTIIELFNIDVGKDMYFGVNGLSTEPTFALDNRILDVVLDDYIYSLRNHQQIDPVDQSINMDLDAYIQTYKMMSDYLLSSKDKLKALNLLLNNI